MQGRIIHTQQITEQSVNLFLQASKGIYYVTKKKQQLLSNPKSAYCKLMLYLSEPIIWANTF